MINQKRLIHYPRIIAAVIWIVYILNVVFRKGWEGGIGGLISFDFLTFYAIGKIYLTAIAHLYDFSTQFQVEQVIYSPTSLNGGGNIYPSPPYVAAVYSLFTLLPYSWAFFVWTIVSLMLIIIAVYWINKYLIREELLRAGLTHRQLLIVVLSFFPVVFGLNLGQNHALTFFLLTGIVIFSLTERWYLAGVFAGLLAYKPQFVIGFLILWVVWRQYKALAAFLLVVALWLLPVIVHYGLEPFLAYLNALPSLILLPYGVGRFLEVSLFALLATAFPPKALPGILMFNQVMLVIASIGLALVAYKLRNIPMKERNIGLILAILFPFFVAPHILIYDLLILVLVFILWSHIKLSKTALYLAIFTYFGSLLLLFVTYPTGVALLAFIPVLLLIFILPDSLPFLSRPLQVNQ